MVYNCGMTYKIVANLQIYGGDTMQDYIEVKSYGKVTAKQGKNPRSPYKHQIDAMANLNVIDQENSFSTLVVLPTGGGKTYTASTWLLKHAIDKKKKIIWIAHRQMLLDQAAESFQRFAYAEALPHINEFTYRIVSGSNNHDRSIDISPRDNILILSKDSIGRNLSVLDKWLEGEKEVYFVIDEAHHATAKTYRKIIKYVEERVPNVKLLGLTATPFRTETKISVNEAHKIISSAGTFRLRNHVHPHYSALLWQDRPTEDVARNVRCGTHGHIPARHNGVHTQTGLPF